MFNLIFHQLTADSIKDKDIYNVSVKKFMEILVGINKVFPDQYRIYFDDGHSTFIKYALPIINSIAPGFKKHNIVLAITTDWIDREGFMTVKELKSLYNTGVRIASHGTSHSALAVSKSIKDRNTPDGGMYSNGKFGFDARLSENEVLYQFWESKKNLESYGIEVNEFVFPFGLYNDASIRINSYYGFYKYLATCDEYLDEYHTLKPRILIDQHTTSESLLTKLRKLPSPSNILDAMSSNGNNK